MASKTSRAEPLPADAELRRVSHGELAAKVAARKVELGLPDPPRNAGNNRTASKRAMLKAIEDAGGAW